MKLALALLLLAAPPRQQDFGSLDPLPAKPHQFVRYATEELVVPARRRALLELRFSVQEGYHVNSHLPGSDLQIPTRIELQPDPGVQLAPATYPPGALYRLPSDPKDVLDVYTGNFTVSLPVIATPGPHELKGSLKYQACDHAACYPPKTLPITVLFKAQ